MAIQLSERDNLIFKLIDEHQVLLEKHIAWFISCDEKPVLIRDRLRKLFYLDYLLCERHGGKLPWWTTPTKPLVYMLSPLTRQIVHSNEAESDLFDCETQRHLLEVANLRMLLLMDQKAGTISDLQWTTNRKAGVAEAALDAVVSFKRNGAAHRIGIINHPVKSAAEITALVQKAIADGTIDSAWVVSRDEAHLNSLQKAFAGSALASKIAFTTHQDAYKSGMVKAKWQGSTINVGSAIAEAAATLGWTASLTAAQAF